MPRVIKQHSRPAFFIAVFALLGVILLASSFALSDTTPPSVPGNFHWGCHYEGTGTQKTIVCPSGHEGDSQELSITVYWTPSTDNVGVDHYEFDQNGTTVNKLISKTATSYTDTNLQPGHTYLVALTAVDAAGNRSAGMPTVTVGTLPDIKPPTKPTNFTSKFNATATPMAPAQSVTLNWSPSTDEYKMKGYTILRDDSSTPIGTVPDGTLTYNDTSPPINKSVTYKVQAVDSWSNNSDASSPSTVITDIQPPLAVTDLDAVSVANTSITIGGHLKRDGVDSQQWTPPTDNFTVVSYDIVQTGPEGTKTVNQSAANPTSYYAGGLTRSTEYSFYVVAIDQNGNRSPKSNTVTRTTTNVTPDGTAPTIPTNLKVVRDSLAPSSQLNLSWTASTDNVGVAGYDIYSGINYKLLAHNVAATNYSFANLQAAKTYKYYISAHDAAGNSSGPTSTVTISTGQTSSLAHINGKITNSSGGGVTSALVKLSAVGQSNKLFYSDSAGNYSVSYGLNGTYSLAYSANGYASKTVKVTISTGQTINNQNVTLTSQ